MVCTGRANDCNGWCLGRDLAALPAGVHGSAGKGFREHAAAQAEKNGNLCKVAATGATGFGSATFFLEMKTAESEVLKVTILRQGDA
jgi:hypothetical protein